MLCRGFDRLHPDFIKHLKKNVTAMRTLLMAHVVPMTWYSPGITDGLVMKTLLGSKIKIAVAKDGEEEIMFARSHRENTYENARFQARSRLTRPR